MRIAFHLAHPAHYHLFKHVAGDLCQRHEVLVTYNEKDVLEELIRQRPLGDDSVKIRSKKGKGSVGLARQFIQKEVNLFREFRRRRPDLLVGTSIIIAHIGAVLKIPSIIVNEDDFDVIAGTAQIGYPFASHILAPACCRVGRWQSKVITYDSYHELAYLSPKYFTPDPDRVAGLGSGTYFIIRFSALSAHHDFGKTGISGEIAARLIELLRPYGRIHITSEGQLDPELEPYRIRIHPLDIHHALAGATLYIGDSQTMAAEAAVLGTPSLRFNDFVGKISYLDELEQRYGLTYGIKTTEPDALYSKIEELLGLPSPKEEWGLRRQRMLAEKIDLAAFLVWFIETYPKSSRGAAQYSEHMRLSMAQTAAVDHNGSHPRYINVARET